MIVEAMKTFPCFDPDKPATDAQINELQNKIGIRFADDYRDYLSAYGLVSFYGVELTGVTHVKWLNVADVTLEARLKNNLPKDYYVVEKLNINDVLAVQSTDGRVYLYRNGSFKSEADSLEEYLKGMFCDKLK